MPGSHGYTAVHRDAQGNRHADGLLVHRVRAERALGHPLPRGVVVHHADGTKADDSPLVICQDAAYHRLLHARMRVKAAGGNPNTHRICESCRMVKALSEFILRRDRRNGREVFRDGCRSCRTRKRRRCAQYASQKQSAATIISCGCT